MPHRFFFAAVNVFAHRLGVVAVRARVQFFAHYAEMRFEHVYVGGGKVAHRVNIELIELGGGALAHHQHFGYRQFPQHPLVVGAHNHRGCVGLSQVARHFGKHLVKTHARAQSKSRFGFNRFAYPVRHLLARAEYAGGGGNVEPAFVGPERLDLTGKAGVNIEHLLGVAHIFRKVRRNAL